MIRWLSTCACVVAVLGAWASPANADSSYTDVTNLTAVFGLGAVEVLHGTETTIPLRVSGELIVAFHADSASGCSQMAACGYHGTLVLKPSSAEVSILRWTAGGRRYRFTALAFDAASESTAPAAFARVLRNGGGVCADASTSDFGYTNGRWRGGRATFPLFTRFQDLRCAGPTPADFAAASPRLILAAAPRAGSVIDAHSVKPFAGHGFAGNVTSTLVFTVGHVRGQNANNAPSGIRTRYQRVRTVAERLQVVGTHGALTADVRGTSMGGVCVFLDSCGLTGTLTLAPRPVSSDGFLTSSGPARLPYRDFLVALGLRPGAHRAGLNPSGITVWADAGTLRADLTQGERCTDTVGLGSGSANVVVRGSSLHVALSTGSFLLTNPGAGSGRTRCPGPELPAFQTLASGVVPRTALGHRTFTITVRGGGGFPDDGYSVSLHGQVSLTFKLGRPISNVTREPTP